MTAAAAVPQGDVCVTREVIMTLIALVLGSRENVSRLLNMKAACHSLFVEGIPNCGDFGIQVWLTIPARGKVDICRLARGSTPNNGCIMRG